MSAEKQMPLFTSSLQMIRELGAKYLPLYALSLDLRHFALIFCFADSSDADDCGKSDRHSAKHQRNTAELL